MSEPEGTPPGGHPVVVYIVGSGRSGSTLLERMLGALPGVVNVGELVATFRNVLGNDELCGCGQAFSRCPFWTAVGTRAFGSGGWDDDVVTDFRRLELEVARQRYFWRNLVPAFRGGQFGAGTRRYSELYGRLYRAILDESGATAVVDASKGLAHALAMAEGGGIDLRLVHLVRDARGVAFSWAKSGVARPQGVVPGATLSTFDTDLTAGRWTLLQTEIALARSRFSGYARLRYEDLVERPAEEVARCMSEVGLPVDPGALGHIEGQAVDLPVSHGLAGNPSRFRVGVQQLRLDEQWRRDMPGWDRTKTTAIALAPLLLYRYLPRDRSQAPA